MVQTGWRRTRGHESRTRNARIAADLKRSMRAKAARGEPAFAAKHVDKYPYILRIGGY